MKLAANLTLAVLAAELLGAAPQVTPPAAPSYPRPAFSDAGGGKLLVESDEGAAVSGVAVFVDAGLDRQAANENGLAALVAECILRTPYSASAAQPATAGAATAMTLNDVSIADAVRASGGLLQYTVDGRSVHFYIEGRGDRMAANLAAFGRALAAPDFSARNVAAARMALEKRIAESSTNAILTGVEMFRRAYYTSSAGAPVYGTSATLAGLAPADAAAFYKANYTRGAVTTTLVGNVTQPIADGARALASLLPAGSAPPVVSPVKTIPSVAPRIVARRDVGAPIVLVGFGAPSPGSREFGAMLVMESLLSSAFERSSATTVTLGDRNVGAFYLYDTVPASLVVYVNGGRVDPSLALREVLVVVRSLASKPLSPSALARFKLAARGAFITDSTTLLDRSYLLGALSGQGLGADPMNGALAALDATTSADLQRVAKKYLQRYIVAVILPRQSADNS